MRPYAETPVMSSWEPRLMGLMGLIQKPEKVDIAWLRKLALNFEKRISKNSELRAKFEDKPEKYVQGL